MQNATWLTQKFPRSEREFWTPCIYKYLIQCKPQLPVSVCLGPCGDYKCGRRKTFPSISLEGDVCKEPKLDVLLGKIEGAFEVNLRDDPKRFSAGNDIAGFSPDILVIRPNKQGVYLMENKPYYESELDGNQIPGGAYAEFTRWINGRVPRCEYLVIRSISMRKSPHKKLFRLQEDLKNLFGIVLLEDVFLQMHKDDFRFPGMTESWNDYTDKSPDFLFV